MPPRSTSSRIDDGHENARNRRSHCTPPRQASMSMNGPSTSNRHAGDGKGHGRDAHRRTALARFHGRAENQFEIGARVEYPGHALHRLCQYRRAGQKDAGRHHHEGRKVGADFTRDEAQDEKRYAVQEEGERDHADRQLALAADAPCGQRGKSIAPCEPRLEAAQTTEASPAGSMSALRLIPRSPGTFLRGLRPICRTGRAVRPASLPRSDGLLR